MRIMSLALYPVENGKFRCRQSARVRTVSDWPIAGYTNSALVGQLDARPFAGTRRHAPGGEGAWVPSLRAGRALGWVLFWRWVPAALALSCR